MLVRSSELDYATFGELKIIIEHNWDEFRGKFSKDIKAVSDTLTNLNALRAVIAHSCELDDAEQRASRVWMENWTKTRA